MLENGKIIDGRYTIREKIGSGGFGAVYLAEDTRFSGNNRVAIKQIMSDNERVAKTSKVEADLLYNLSHPNLPKVTNCFQEEGANFIVMDYISGEDLAQGLLKKRKFQVAEVLKIADTVLDALEYLHSFPIYHRDVKPHNIKIDQKGKIFLLDFGTAKGNASEEAEKTLQFGGQSITGYTPFYAPLEQVLRVDPNSFLLLTALNEEKLRDFAERKTDGRSDIYALGATLYHLLTGFSPEQATATVRAHALWSDKPDPLPNIQTLNAEVSPALANAIHRALEVMPEHRFQTAAEFRQSLKLSQMASVPTQATEVINPAIQYPPAPNQPTSNQPSPTQIAPQIINIRQDAPSVPTFQQPANFVSETHESAPQSNTKNFSLIGLGVILLLVLGASGAGLIWKFASNKAEKTIANTNQSETTALNSGAANGSSQNSANGGAKTNPSQPARNVDYSLLVQKMRDGKKYQEPFESSGQEIFENGYQFIMNLTPSEKGFLYIFAEGLNDKNEKVFNIIFPTPKQNAGLADVSADQKYQTGWNEFSGTAGTENFWVIWSKEKNDTAEKSRENAFANGGKVSDKDLEKKLKDYLESEKIQKTATKDIDKKLSKIEFEGDSAVYLIQLEHR
ncbi:MAG TPA: serine/threonine-protein kinase [Pyrinomonadaceae bacterium]|nr:serine/threonine-protein kinase [Pyrinomonadaceae bacterium]